MKISYSRLAEYAECPRRYFYRYVQGRSLPKQSEEMTLGSVFHELLKFILSPSLLPPTYMDAENHLRSLLSGKLGAEQMEEALALGRKVIENLLQEDTSTILAIEFSFSLPLGRHIINGRMDRVDRHKNGELEIIEYKLRATIKGKDNLQLALYHLAAESIWHPPSIKLTLVSFMDNEKSSFYLDENEIIEGRERIIHLASGIEREDFTPLRGNHCFNCPFYTVCFKEIPPERESLL
ncbi:PD-(D/E)XK nuclease family protein [bacterium]|nr:PD-(D/E)XK nuclease family protein [bacterium]